jgi:hypothetical protein
MVVASSEREKTTKNNSSTHTRVYATNIFNNQGISSYVPAYLYETGHTLYIVFVSDAARSVDKEIEHFPSARLYSTPYI